MKKSATKSKSEDVDRCEVFGCSNTTANCTAVLFHPFPKNPRLAEEWMTRCCVQIPFFDPTEHKICSVHFTKDDYEDDSKRMRTRSSSSSSSGRVLKKDCVPTLLLPRKSPVSKKKPIVEPAVQDEDESDEDVQLISTVDKPVAGCSSWDWAPKMLQCQHCSLKVPNISTSVLKKKFKPPKSLPKLVLPKERVTGKQKRKVKPTVSKKRKMAGK